MAACGDGADGGTATSTDATAAPTTGTEAAEPLASAPTGEATESPGGQDDAVRSGAADRGGAAAPGIFGGGPGGSGFGAAAMVDAVIAAVAEATGVSPEAVQSLQQSGTTLADILDADGADREGLVNQVVEEIQASLPAAGDRGTGARGQVGGQGGAAQRGGDFDLEAVLRDSVNALIDGDDFGTPGGFRELGGMVQAVEEIVAEHTDREPDEVREIRSEGRSFASILFGAGIDLESVVDEIVEALEEQFADAERPDDAPEPPSGEELRAAVDAFMSATDDGVFTFGRPQSADGGK